MDKLIELLKDPVWWISTVLVAIAVNLLSNYLWRFVDRWLLNRQRREAKRFVKRLLVQSSFSASAEELMADPRLVFTTMIDNQTEGRYALLMFVLGVSQLMYFYVEYTYFPGWYTYGMLIPAVLCLSFFVVIVRRRTYRSLLLEKYAKRVKGDLPRE